MSCPAAISHERHFDRFLEILDSLLLALADCVVFVVANQSVRNITERALDGLLIGDQSLPFLRLRIPQIVAQRAALKDRLAQTSRVASYSERSRNIPSRKCAMSESCAARAKK